MELKYVGGIKQKNIYEGRYVFRIYAYIYKCHETSQKTLKSGMTTRIAPYNIQGSRGDCEHFLESGDPQGACYK